MILGKTCALWSLFKSPRRQSCKLFTPVDRSLGQYGSVTWKMVVKMPFVVNTGEVFAVHVVKVFQETEL